MKSIMIEKVICPKCGWTGTIGDCEPDVDGDGNIGCPECLTVVIIDHNSREIK